jgi:hypothetical protein
MDEKESVMGKDIVKPEMTEEATVAAIKELKGRTDQNHPTKGSANEEYLASVRRGHAQIIMLKRSGKDHQ